jgi:sigma-B regulation protein RsbU (phosphoserine phosphatase)
MSTDHKETPTLDPESDACIRADIESIARISAVPTILRVISEMTGLRLALVARVTANTWTACAVHDELNFGLGVGGQLDVATTICSEVRDALVPIVIEHASVEPEYCTHPTPKLYGFESYFSQPLFRSSGQYFGTLCALDPKPATLRDTKTRETFRLFSELISLQLAAEENAARDREALADAQETARLREQFVAVLGHDLRNPLNAMVAGSAFLLDRPLGNSERTIVERLSSSARRMTRLVADLMDLARGRPGIAASLNAEVVDVDAIVDDVVGEIASLHEDRTIHVVTHEAGRARVDASRFGQMVSNLVANAVEHGGSDNAVSVSATRSEDDEIVITVENRGKQIEAGQLSRIFEAYERGGARQSSGLGLGLHIAREIARAHGGDITATSGPDGVTRFVIRVSGS